MRNVSRSTAASGSHSPSARWPKRSSKSRSPQRISVRRARTEGSGRGAGGEARAPEVAGRRGGAVALGGDAAVPVRVRRGARIGRDEAAERVLAGRLVEVAVGGQAAARHGPGAAPGAAPATPA